MSPHEFEDAEGHPQASRGNAPKDRAFSPTLPNMKTFMTSDAPYRSATRTCSTHNRMSSCALSRFPRRCPCDRRSLLRAVNNSTVLGQPILYYSNNLQADGNCFEFAR